MQEYYCKAWVGKEGVVKVLYSYSYLPDLGHGQNLVCLVDGLVADIWKRDHNNITTYLGHRVIHVHSDRFTSMIPLTPLTKELF